MPFSKSLVQSFRKNTLMVGSGWRAFFAPYNIALGSALADTTKGPKIIDLTVQIPFDTNNPPSGWFDLGWIRDFRPAPENRIGQVRSGHRGAVRAQYRGQVGERLEFRFREAGRMQFKIAQGVLPINLLKNPGPASSIGPVSASGAQSVPLHASGYQENGAGSTAGSPTVFVPAGSGSLFTVGDFIVVDNDYTLAQTGVVGDVGVPILESTQVVDVNYLRRTSDYVARVSNIVPNAVSGADGLVLARKLVGGGSGNPTGFTAPRNTAKVQKVIGFASRSGGTYIKEWSAVFVMDLLDQAQILCYYPHLSPAEARAMEPVALENAGTTDLNAYEMPCALEALAFDDPLDGETVVGYTAYVPRADQDFNI